MAKFIPYNYEQRLLVAINFNEQILPGTFEYALHHLIEQRIDLSCFNECYKNDSTGRPAINPSLLLKVILYGYYKGVVSSRQLESCCRENIVFMALSCETTPDHSTIANFVSSHTVQIQSIFEQLVLVCHEEGLIGNELIAIDGCKLPSNAAKEWSGTFKELGEKQASIKRRIKVLMKEHRAMDKLDDEQAAKAERHNKAIQTLNKAHDRIERFLASETPRMGKAQRVKEVKSNITDNESCKMLTSKGTIQGYNGVATADSTHQVIIDAKAYGEGQEQHTLIPTLEAIEQRFSRLGIHPSIFDSDIKVTADTGYANESNMRYVREHEIDAYIPDNQFRRRDKRFDNQKTKYGRVDRAPRKTPPTYTADQFTLNEKDKSCICPAGVSLRLEGQRKDASGNDTLYFKGKTSTCRDCAQKTKCMRNPSTADTRMGHGRQVSFMINASTNKTPNTNWMKERIDSDYGRYVYGHRMSVIEPVFGNLEANKGLRRFTLRTQEKVNAQWQLYCSVHNIEKIGHYGRSYKTENSA